MANTNATCSGFSKRIIEKDVSYQFSLKFLNNEEQTKIQLSFLGHEKKSLRSEQRGHPVSALESSQQPQPNKKSRQNATGSCNYCRTKGHTPSWCRKKSRLEKIKRVQNGITLKNTYVHERL